jgi:hypothetical protein
MQVRIPVPSRKQQEKIKAAFLSAQEKASNLKAEAEKLHAKSQTLLIDSMQEVVAGFVKTAK